MTEQAPTKPRPKGRTAAERKRDQRLRQEIQRAKGRPPITAENMQAAIYDALSLMLRDRNHAGHAEVVIRNAGFLLFDSKRATAEMRRRLLGRLPKVYKD